MLLWEENIHVHAQNWIHEIEYAEAGKGENIASTPEVSGTVYQRSPSAMTERREQHKGADGKAVCMYRKQSVIPQKHEKVSKDVRGKEAPNLDLYFLAVWSLASCTTSLSLSFLLFKNELPKKKKKWVTNKCALKVWPCMWSTCHGD